MGFWKVLGQVGNIMEAAVEARQIQSMLRGDLIPKMKRSADEEPVTAFVLTPSQRDLLIQVADGLELIGRKLGKL